MRDRQLLGDVLRGCPYGDEPEYLGLPRRRRFSSASLRRSTPASPDGIASPSISRPSARPAAPSTRLSSSRGCFLFGTPRSCLPTLKKYSAVSALAKGAHDEKLSVDTRAISWLMHMGLEHQPLGQPRDGVHRNRVLS